MNSRDATTALVLSTLAFAFSAASWGMIVPIAKTPHTDLYLTRGKTQLMIAVPIPLVSMTRIPSLMPVDRFGGRIVFGLLPFIAPPVFMLSLAHSFNEVVLWGLLLVMLGAYLSASASVSSRRFFCTPDGIGVGGDWIDGTQVPIHCSAPPPDCSRTLGREDH